MEKRINGSIFAMQFKQGWMDNISKEELKLQLHNQFEAFIKSRGKRQTQERYKILDKIVDRGSHFDIEDLYRDLESTYHVSRATVYNTVGLLCEAGILNRSHLQGNQTLYELTGTQHIHLICSGCGEVTEITDETLSAHLGRMKFRRFKVLSVTANFYGLCSQCRKKTKMPRNG